MLLASSLVVRSDSKASAAHRAAANRCVVRCSIANEAEAPGARREARRVTLVSRTPTAAGINRRDALLSFSAAVCACCAELALPRPSGANAWVYGGPEGVEEWPKVRSFDTCGAQLFGRLVF